MDHILSSKRRKTCSTEHSNGNEELPENVLPDAEIELNRILSKQTISKASEVSPLPLSGAESGFYVSHKCDFLDLSPNFQPLEK